MIIFLFILLYYI